LGRAERDLRHGVEAGGDRSRQSGSPSTLEALPTAHRPPRPSTALHPRWCFRCNSRSVTAPDSPRGPAGRQGRNKAERCHQPVERDCVTSRRLASPRLDTTLVALPPRRECHLGGRQHYHPDGGKQGFHSRSPGVRGQLPQPGRWGRKTRRTPQRRRCAGRSSRKLDPALDPSGSGHPRQRRRGITLGARKTPETQRSPNPRGCRCLEHASAGGRRAWIPASRYCRAGETGQR